MSAAPSDGYATRLASPDERTALAAASECARALRSSDVDLDRIEIAEQLSALLGHPSPEIRQEIAGACDTFPEPYFSDALGRLTADPDRFVQNAAKRAGERRARFRKERRTDETREEVLAGLLGQIEDGLGAPGRAVAARAVRRGVEYFVGRLDHEVKKSDQVIERALAAIDAEIAKPAPSQAALRSHVAEIREHFDFVRAMIRRGREYAVQRRAELADECLAEVVEVARRQLFERLGARACAVDFTCAIDRDLRMELDRSALLQAFQNVFQNAVEAYDSGDARIAIEVSARVALAGAQVELCVADRGRGITNEGLAKLYLPFGSSKPGGTGLGMSIVRNMIEEVHEGKLVVDSEPGVGTTVTMRLPIAAHGRAEPLILARTARKRSKPSEPRKARQKNVRRP